MEVSITDADPSTFWKRITAFAIGAVLCVLVYLFLLNFPGLGQRSRTAGIVPVIALAASTWWLTSRFLRLDGMSFSDLGLSAADNRVIHLGIGFLGGAGLTAIWLSIIAFATAATWHPNPAFRPLALIGVCLFNFFNNVGEELVYRGYAFLRLLERFGLYLTVVVTSSIFALLHLQAGIPWLSVVAGVFTSGLVFAAIFARWRSLPLALGFHVATNIVQDASGLRASAASLFSIAYPASSANSGTVILTGIALVNLLLAAGILVSAPRSENTFVDDTKSQA